MSDKNALNITTSAMYALEKIGLPEGKIPLVNAIIYVCAAEKSNSTVVAIAGAEQDIKNNPDDRIPPYLLDTSYASLDAKKISGQYLYPHNFGGYIKQQYLPDALKDRVYYTPQKNGDEKNLILKKFKDDKE